MEKVFSVHSERIKILRNRGMTIDNGSDHKELLKKYNYYNLINAYKDPFLYHGSSSIERYISGTKLSELEALIKFDTNLRLLFLREILKIEEIIKNQLVQSFYSFHLYKEVNNSEVEKSFLHRDSEYLRRKYYDLSPLYSVHTNDNYGITSTVISTTRPGSHYTTLDRQSIYDNYIATVYRTLGQQRKKNDSIKSYLEQHGYIPMWIIMNVLTFGNVSHLFTVQKKSVQLDIIKALKLISIPVVPDDISIINTSRIFQILSIYRNICAHNERFYSTKVKVPIDDVFMDFGKKLPFTVNPASHRRLNHSQAKIRMNARQGIYTLIYIISLFKEKGEFNSLISEILNELKILENNISTISITEIKQYMGLNFDWTTSIKN